MMSLWHQGFVRKNRVCPVMVSIRKWNCNIQHPVQTLYNGLLLEPKGIQTSTADEPVKISICGNCAIALCHKNDTPPLLSLANNLWISPIPWQLQILTFSKQLLIALLYPCIFVFKLYSKGATFCPGSKTLQWGMRGTVSMFEPDITGVSTMTQGNMMPRPTSILPSVMLVTFIGKGQVPKRQLGCLFHIHCQFIFEALCWLKENNPKYYGDIVIDRSCIQSLPHNDVPNEVLSITRQSTDVGIIDEESEGYVPTYDTDGVQIYTIQ